MALLTCSLKIYSQDEGFATDEIIEDFLGRNIKTFYSYDNSGALLSQPTLFSDIDFSSYDLLSASVNFSDKNSTQKIVFSPIKLIRTDRKAIEFFRASKINLSQKDGITTIGVSIGGDNSSPFSRRSLKLIPIYPSPDTGNPTMSFGDFVKAQDGYKKKLKEMISKFDSDRLKSVFKYSLGYNIQLFSVFGANGDSKNFDSLNSNSIKSHTISASLTHSRNSGSFEITGTYNYILSRNEAAEGNKIKPYDGPSLSIKQRIVSLIPKSKLLNSTEYIKSHFIPSIDFGVAFEGKYYKDSDLGQAEKGVRETEVLTFFLDFKISPSAQFRLGIPHTKAINIDDSSDTSFGAILQYSFKIVNLGE